MRQLIRILSVGALPSLFISLLLVSLLVSAQDTTPTLTETATLDTTKLPTLILSETVTPSSTSTVTETPTPLPSVTNSPSPSPTLLVMSTPIPVFIPAPLTSPYTPTPVPQSLVNPTFNGAAALTPCPQSAAPDVTNSTFFMSTAALRSEFSIFNPNYFFIVNTSGSIDTYPVRPWLWPPYAFVPVSGNLVPVTAPPPTPAPNWAGSEVIAFPGVIPWADPNIEWIQIVLPYTYGAGSANVITYMDKRTIVVDCEYLSLPIIEDPRLLTAIPPSTMNAAYSAPTPGPTLSWVSPFGKGLNLITTPIDLNPIPPAHMGTYGLHYGPNPTAGFGTTIDVVPVNMELCIDTDATQTNCDPPQPPTPLPGTPIPTPIRVPVYAPVTGCAIYNDLEEQIEISIITDDTGALNCDFGIETYDRQIILTHITASLVPSNQRIEVFEGRQIASLCLYDEAEDLCNIQNEVPVHLAYQPRLWSSTIPPNGNLGATPDIVREVIGIVVQDQCLYDIWASDLGATPHPPSTPVTACP